MMWGKGLGAGADDRPRIIKAFRPLAHEGFATHGVNPVIRVDPKPPLSVEPARAAVS
jgi:hypothetical protein